MEIALIGIGRWGTILKRYIDADKRFTLKYICNSKSDLNEVWNDKNVKGVIITTPNETHYQLTMTALKNRKNVFVEKPLAYHVDECLKVRWLACLRKKSVLVDFTYTFSPVLNNLTLFNMKLKRDCDDPLWRLGPHCLAILDTIKPIKDIKFTRNENTIIFPQGIIDLSTGARETDLRMEFTYDFQTDNLKYALDAFYRGETNIDRAIEVTRVLEKLSENITGNRPVGD
jgi:hypothetical protein